jgi:acyl-CoA thioesterase FadM
MDYLLQVTSHIIKQGKASLQFEQCLYRHDSLLCRALIDIACVENISGNIVFFSQ